MCRLLSSLAPGFEGHWWYVRKKVSDGLEILCVGHIDQCIEESLKICPAWQVEDVLRNWTEITVKVPTLIMSWHEKISWLLVSYPDTAYQKIEEYLWSILK
jgi:hypothetical protein